MKGSRVVEGGVLEDETSKISMGGDDVVGFLLLTKLVSVVGGFVLGGFTDQGGCDQGSVHGREKRRSKYTSYTGHVEGLSNKRIEVT